MKQLIRGVLLALMLGVSAAPVTAIAEQDDTQLTAAVTDHAEALDRLWEGGPSIRQKASPALGAAARIRAAIASDGVAVTASRTRLAEKARTVQTTPRLRVVDVLLERNWTEVSPGKDPVNVVSFERHRITIDRRSTEVVADRILPDVAPLTWVPEHFRVDPSERETLPPLPRDHTAPPRALPRK